MNENTKKQIISIATAGVLFTLAMILFQLQYIYDNKYTNGAPYGEEGLFAFNEADLNTGKPLYLIDGWEFYADTWITPEAFAQNIIGHPVYVFIGQYPNFSFISDEHSPYGQATYRLTLKYQGMPQILMLEIPEIFTDYTLWINGEKAAASGKAIPIGLIDTVEIVLNVTNQSHYYSGLTYPPALGTPQTIHQMYLIRNIFYGLLCFFPLALCLYAMGAWRQPKLGSRFIHFGLLCLFFSIHCMYPFVHQLGLTGTFWYAIEDVSWMAMLYQVLILCSIEAQMISKFYFRKIIRPVALFLCILCGISVIFILPNAGSLIHIYGTIMDGYKSLCWVFLIICAIHGLRKGQKNATVILSGGSIMGAAMMINRVDNNLFEPIYLCWQTEAAGFAMVLSFFILAVRHEKELILNNQRLTKHLEEEVIVRTSELHAVLNERKAFFSDLAHNLKAPVAAIHGFTELILRGNLYLDKELKDYIDQINIENDELQSRMSALSNLNAYDKINEPREVINVNDLLQKVYTDNEPEACISGIQLQVCYLENQASVCAQRKKLLILFENLIYNSFSFTPEGGIINLSAETSQNTVIFKLSDTGCGIDALHLPHIFERFYVGRSNTDEGSGLGLYIAQLTVNELGGSINASSTPGAGTTFTITLPLYLT